jgi:hypothetical protein
LLAPAWRNHWHSALTQARVDLLQKSEKDAKT